MAVLLGGSVDSVKALSLTMPPCISAQCLSRTLSPVTSGLTCHSHCCTVIAAHHVRCAPWIATQSSHTPHWRACEDNNKTALDACSGVRITRLAQMRYKRALTERVEAGVGS